MTSNQEGPVVSFDGVGKIYAVDGLRVSALRVVTLKIPRRRFAMIVGPSGSGKTTLLNLVGCIDTPTSGRLRVCGEDVGAMSDRELTDFRSKNIAFVFQNFNLLPVLTAYENVEYPLLLLGAAASERRQRTMQMLEAVCPAHKPGPRPHPLSGRPKQRRPLAPAPREA